MNVTTEDIRNIKPGSLKLFKCEDETKMQSAASLIGQIKRLGMPERVVDYEYRKFFDEGNLILIRALREGDEKVLNR